MSARLLAAALALAWCAGAASAQQHDGGADAHAYVAPSPGELGGTLSLRDSEGSAFTNDNLHGRWTMLYFGYARCRSACPVALPTLADAADALNERGIPAHAVFVDLEAAPAPIALRSEAAARAHASGHDAHGSSAQFPGVTLLTGTRGQIRQALTAFHVRADHMPPRTSLGETGHSINHTTAIYIIDPTGAVVGYAYHTVTPADLVARISQQAATPSG